MRLMDRGEEIADNAKNDRRDCGDAIQSTVFAQVLFRETPIYRGAVVWCRERKSRGTFTGGRKPCKCGWERLFVRWDDGSQTCPCIKALDQIGPNEFKIM